MFVDKLARESQMKHAQESAGSGLTNHEQKVLSEMPKDIRTVYKVFDLDPELTVFATCPSPTCCATYHPEFDASTGSPIYPLRCNRSKFGKECGEFLTKSSTAGKISVPTPLRPYPYHHFNDHVSAMLSRPGIEEAILSHQRSGSLDRELRDILDAPVLRNFKGPDGKPFLRDCGEEIRLVWAFCADWYNPYHNKTSGKTVSFGIMAMICLSLPPELRTREENIYFCSSIPGPQEPSVDATNEFLRPLMFDLSVSYHAGIHHSRTHDCPTGRTSRSAVIPIIADTMASKKITGHIGHRGKYPCSRCRLQRHDLDNLDKAAWPPPLSRAEHEELAVKWRTASSQKEQNIFLKEDGIRWSAFLILTYWQPYQWTISEGAHILLLGLLPCHTRNLLGLNFKDLPDEEEEEEIPPQVMQSTRAAYEKAITLGSKKPLKGCKMPALRALCLERAIRIPPPQKGRRKKAEYIAALLVSRIS